MSRSRGRMVVALSATTTAGYGVLFYAYGVLLIPMQTDLGWSRSYLSGVFSVALVVGALLAIPVGRWLDRHPPRSLLLAGAFASTALTAGWAAADGRFPFLAVWVLLGACQALLFYEPAFTILAKWFAGHDRNRAITTVTLVAGLASTIFGPLTALLERSFGWRGAVLVLAGLLAAVTVPAFAWGLPREVGEGGDAPAVLDALPRDVFRTRPFWVLTLAYTFSSITTFGVAVHLVAFLRGRGVGAGTAATVLGAVGLVQVLGRSAFIRLSANRASVHLATWVLSAKAVGLALLVVVPGAPGVVLFVLIYGSANGMGTLTRATTIAELYGARHYGSISSVIASVTAVAGAVAPFAVAVAADLIGADAPVLIGLVALCVLAAVANESVGRPTRGAALDDVESVAVPEP